MVARLRRLPHAHGRLDELRTSAPRAAGSVALWAGAEYATVWNGYMDGAVRSGQHAAREALERL
jgi:monoamine oxidase